MSRNRWNDIRTARRILGLPEMVTRAEIQDAYRLKCRDLHPDRNPGVDTSEDMAEINAAYRLLMEYADGYTMRLCPNEDGMTDQEWWMHRFGQDPLWAGDRTDE